MTDTRAEVAEKTPPTEIRIAPTRGEEASTHRAGKRAPGDGGGAGRPKMLMAVAGVLFLVLVGGALAVIRAFTSPAQTTNGLGGSGDHARRETRGAEAIEAALAAAHDYANNREYSKAEAILSQAVHEHPSDQPLRLELARTLVAEKKYAEAYPHYEAALAIGASSDITDAAIPAGSPADSQASAKRTKLLGDPKLHFEAGTIASKAGLLDRAEEHYSMAQTGDMTDARYPLFLGMVQLRLNKESAAQASLVRAVTLDPSQSVAWGTLAELSLKNNQLGLALQHIEKTRTLDPATPRWRLVQAKALKRRGEKDDTELAAQLLLAMDKSEQVKPEALAVLSECYGMLHRPTDAAALYAEAGRLRPDDAELAYQAAIWYQRAGDAEQALRYAKAAAALKHEQAASLVKELSAK